MNFDWSEFLRIARELSARDDEASHRIAISRAYYAAFNTARNLQRADGLISLVGSSGDHMVLRRVLHDAGQLALADRLNQLREWRNKADYNTLSLNARRPVSKSMAGHAVVMADGLVTALTAGG